MARYKWNDAGKYDYVRQLRSLGMTYQQISDDVFNKFGVRVTKQQVYNLCKEQRKKKSRAELIIDSLHYDVEIEIGMLNNRSEINRLLLSKGYDTNYYVSSEVKRIIDEQKQNR